MDDGLFELIIVVVFGVIIGFTLTATVLIATGNTYKQGQIDALTGNIKYEPVTLPDSTKEWRAK